MVGTSGMSGQRVSPVTARHRKRASLDVLCSRRQRAGAQLCGAAEQSLNGVAAALEHDVFQLGQIFAELQNLELDLRCRADWRCRTIKLLRIGPGERDEFLHRLR